MKIEDDRHRVPPDAGPWRIRWERPSGDSGLGRTRYLSRADADRDAELCCKNCQEVQGRLGPYPVGARVVTEREQRERLALPQIWFVSRTFEAARGHLRAKAQGSSSGAGAGRT